jgi:hypothetical protein
VTDDPFDNPEWRAYERRAEDDLVPKMIGSEMVLSLVPRGPTDIKFALELGMAIMLDKPIIAVVVPGATVPAKLVLIADAIVEGDLGPDMQKRLIEAMRTITEKREGED